MRTTRHHRACIGSLARPFGSRLVLLTLIVATAAVSAQTGAQPGVAPPDLAHTYDVRVDKSVPDAAAYLERVVLRADFTPAGDPRFGARATAIARLAADEVDMSLSPESRALEVVRARPGRDFLTGPSTNRVAALRGFLSTHAPAFGISDRQIDTLEVVADYENPAGNMAWVELEQRINDIPVFRGYIRGGFTARGELAATTGQLAADLDGAPLATLPAIAAADAVSRAAAHVGWAVTAGALVEKSVEAGRRRVTLSGGPFARDTRASHVYFPLAPGVARLAWATEIWSDTDAFLVVLDAEDGTVLFRKNLTDYQTQPATYVVYNDDSPAPASPTPALPGAGYQAPFISRSSITLIGNEAPNVFNNLGWMTDGTNETQGNNVIAGLDWTAPDGVDATVTGSSFRIFNFSYDPQTDEPLTTVEYQRGGVTNMFFWVNRFHDATYLLGFTEGARNFQNVNFGPSGTGGDRVSAEGQDGQGVNPNINNANFSTGPDGGTGRMQMYIWPGPTPDRSGDIDNDVIVHELTHGLSNRLHANAAGLTSNMARGMGEGWSDFYARSLLAQAGENVNGIYNVGGWVTFQATAGYTSNYYYGIRRFPYAVKTTVGGALARPHNPLTFADVDATQIDISDGAFPRGPFGSATADVVHNMGEVWAVALFEVRARFIARLGFATGNQRILQYVTDGMKLDPAAPTFLQARDSILAAASAGGGTAADIADIWAGFATRGMGVLAQVLNDGGNTGGGTTRVVENFNVPGDPLPAFTINDVSLVEGASGTTTATFTVTLANPNVAESRVNFTTTDITAISSVTQTSGESITIPNGAPGTTNGAAIPYPATLNVAGVPGTIQHLSVRLNGFTHTWPADVDVLLVGPGGQRSILISDVGGGTDVNGVNITLDDGAPALGTSALATGTYAPTDLQPGDVFPAPAPSGPHGAALSVFNGTGANGTWNLYVFDGASGDVGSLASFSLIITASGADYLPASGLLTFPPGTTTRTIPVTVYGDLLQEPNETFTVTLLNPANGVIADGSGVGTILNDDGGGAAPTSVNDTYATAYLTPLIIAPPGVLANDNSNGGGAMRAVLVTTTTNGVLALNADDGSFSYTPNAGFVGGDSFTYRATNDGGAGNAATVTITVGPPTTPQAPTGLYVAAVDGNLVTLRWTASPADPAADTFVLEGGLLPDQVLASLPTGSPAPIFTFVAPSGSFFVRVHQISGADRSPASNEVPLHVNVPVPPSAPAGLVGVVNGSSLDLAWRNTFGGGPPTSLILDVAGTVTGSIPLAADDHASFPFVPGGTYTMSLRAANASGVSGPSGAVSVTIPTACSGVPNPPENLLFYKAGGVASAVWDPAATGPAATSYVVDVSGPFSISLPTTSRSVSGVPPPGSYTLNVVAVNACGTSAPTSKTLSFP